MNKEYIELILKLAKTETEDFTKKDRARLLLHILEDQMLISEIHNIVAVKDLCPNCKNGRLVLHEKVPYVNSYRQCNICGATYEPHAYLHDGN